MTTVVEAESLTKRFGDVPAVTDLSFGRRREENHMRTILGLCAGE
jgi:hypothetical protein